MTKQGDPRASRHLRPATIPDPVRPETGTMPVDPTGPNVISEEEIAEMDADLRKLMEPFPRDQIEKLPKPMWRGAWDDERSSRCEECGGYHPAVNTIHLDYVGHAGVTRRLLEVDPLWDWEPVSVDEDGLPKLDAFGGLWIKLRVCGITRLGYGDAVGKRPGTTAVKEIIGDAIRNAAMRFGVALDLWSKLDRHEGKNPGAISGADNWQTQVDNRASTRGRQKARGGGASASSRSGGPSKEVADAIAEVASICDAHGYSYQYADERFESDYGCKPQQADVETIRAFGQLLIEEATPDRGGAVAGGEGTPDADTGGGGAAEAKAVGEPDSADKPYF